MEQSIKMDDLGGALFEETPIAPMHRILYWTYPPFAGNFHWNFHFFWGGNRIGIELDISLNILWVEEILNQLIGGVSYYV